MRLERNIGNQIGTISKRYLKVSIQHTKRLEIEICMNTEIDTEGRFIKISDISKQLIDEL